MAHAAVHGSSEGLYLLFPFVIGINLSYLEYRGTTAIYAHYFLISRNSTEL